jgi:hypothetical protein
MLKSWLAAIVPALLAALVFSTPARAWGSRGHRVAARIAQDRLTPKARAAVRDLLNGGDTLVDIAGWADNDGYDAVPGSGPWHYVNVPLTARRYDRRYCSERGCVVSQIHHFRKVLADTRAPRKDRQRALLFLVHFVQDVHQPLHVGDNKDRGGNQTQLQFEGRGTNLHRLWDSDIINSAKGGDNGWHERISPLLTRENVAAWSKGDVEHWADESLEEARKAYDSPPLSRQAVPSGSTIGGDYVAFATPIIARRLAQAGVRLANELNAVFQ